MVLKTRRSGTFKELWKNILGRIFGLKTEGGENYVVRYFTFYTLLQKMLGIKSVSMKWVGFVLRLRGGDTPAKFCS